MVRYCIVLVHWCVSLMTPVTGIGSSRFERLLALCKSADLTTSLTPCCHSRPLWSGYGDRSPPLGWLVWAKRVVLYCSNSGVVQLVSITVS